VLELTLTEPPDRFGATHWSSRLLAAALAGEGTPISHATVARIWNRFGVQPWRAATFTFSTDPALEAKVRDVVGLYLHPSQKAVVLCVDEKPRIQTRSGPPRPCRCGPAIPREPASTTSGTAPPRCSPPWKVTTGKVTDVCAERHRHQEFGAFLTAGCPGLSAPRAARGRRQPVHPQAPDGPGRQRPT
jgi:hypothetical protein